MADSLLDRAKRFMETRRTDDPYGTQVEVVDLDRRPTGAGRDLDQSRSPAPISAGVDTDYERNEESPHPGSQPFGDVPGAPWSTPRGADPVENLANHKTRGDNAKVGPLDAPTALPNEIELDDDRLHVAGISEPDHIAWDLEIDPRSRDDDVTDRDDGVSFSIENHGGSDEAVVVYDVQAWNPPGDDISAVVPVDPDQVDVDTIVAGALAEEPDVQAAWRLEVFHAFVWDQAGLLRDPNINADLSAMRHLAPPGRCLLCHDQNASNGLEWCANCSGELNAAIGVRT